MTEADPIAWLRRRIGERHYLAQHAVELGSAAEWTELSSGVLMTIAPDAPQDRRDGVHALGDSSLTRLMEANDPRDTMARCEMELGILDLHKPLELGAITDALPGTPFPAVGGVRRWLECQECGPNNDDSGIYAAPGRGETFWPCATVRLIFGAYRYGDGYCADWGPLDLTPGTPAV